MSKRSKTVVYDFSGKAPRNAIDGSLELLPNDDAIEQAEDKTLRGLFAGKLDKEKDT
jgi:hypothetical protein